VKRKGRHGGQAAKKDHQSANQLRQKGGKRRPSCHPEKKPATAEPQSKRRIKEKEKGKKQNKPLRKRWGPAPLSTPAENQTTFVTLKYAKSLETKKRKKRGT